MELSRETDTTEMMVLELEQKKVKRSSWNKIRPVIHLIPFVQMYKEKKYPWVQLAGHPGNFTKGVVQVQVNEDGGLPKINLVFTREQY